MNVHKTFRRRLLNVLCTFNLRPVSTGNSQKNCSCFEYHVLRSILFSVKTAEQLKLAESNEAGFLSYQNFIIDIKVAPFKIIDKKDWPMQNLRNRYIQTELEIR